MMSSAAEKDILSLEGIEKELGELSPAFDITLKESVSSTNTVLKDEAAELFKRGELKKDGLRVLISAHQSAGRGRMGRTFKSPKGSGIYLSILMAPDLPAEKAVRITTAAAVAACRAIEECTDERPSIKWVNDIYVRGKKVCGILTEGSADPATGSLNWAVMGIGFNVCEPENGFPEDIQGIAGAISESACAGLKNRLSAAFLKAFRILAAYPYVQVEYKQRSFLIGRNVNVLRAGTSRPAKVLDIDSECRLVVIYEDGTTEALSSGEVSVKSF